MSHFFHETCSECNCECVDRGPSSGCSSTIRDSTDLICNFSILSFFHVKCLKCVKLCVLCLYQHLNSEFFSSSILRQAFTKSAFCVPLANRSINERVRPPDFDLRSQYLYASLFCAMPTSMPKTGTTTSQTNLTMLSLFIAKLHFARSRSNASSV